MPCFPHIRCSGQRVHGLTSTPILRTKIPSAQIRGCGRVALRVVPRIAASARRALRCGRSLDSLFAPTGSRSPARSLLRAVSIRGPSTSHRGRRRVQVSADVNGGTSRIPARRPKEPRVDTRILGLSTTSLLHGARDTDESPARLLKRAAIAFERIFFSPVGLGDASMPLYRDAIAGFFGGSPSEAEFLLDSQAFWTSLLLLPEDLDDQDAVYRALHRPDDPLGLRPIASHLVIEVLPARYFDAPLDSRRGYKQRGSMIGELVEDAYFPARLATWLPGATGLLTPVQRQLQTLAADAGNVRLRRLAEASMTLPVDFGDLSWSGLSHFLMGRRLDTARRRGTRRGS
jgi:hypothetical protein